VVVLEVADTGQGMTAEHAARAFERLYRADASRQRGTGGAGLGLSIVAAIVSAHGGRVELRTAPGAGTSFRVLLPAIPEPDEPEHTLAGLIVPDTVPVEVMTAQETLSAGTAVSLARPAIGTQ
ncbi:MAG TPA: sensor histidine kinase, partial [Rugosimonospora sp.]|nr:sensor histidine kinase [Rugosimonospora sp.]